MTEPHVPDEFHVPDERTLLRATAIAAGVAAVVLLLFVLPAEYGVDVTGFGGAIGITGMAAPGAAAPEVHNSQDDAFRTDTVNVTVPARGSLEYKFRLQESSVLVYEWTATGVVYFDFHGEPAGDTTGFFQSYETGTNVGRDGSLSAPFTGSHGWYVRNDSPNDVTVTLRTAGHYIVIGVP